MRHGLQLSSVSLRRGTAEILKDVTTELAPGQIVGLIGPNGAGKSTLLNAIVGLTACRGEIRWKAKRPNLESVGYMPQNCQVRAQLSVLETVLLGSPSRLGWTVPAQIVADACAVLARFGLADLCHRGMATLSGGQQQMVLLAQRLMRRPDLLLLDEATSALDIRHQMQVFAILRDYVAETGALVLVAIHDLNLASNASDKLMLLKAGRLSACGPVDEVITPEVIENAYGISAEFITSPAGRRCVLPIQAHHGHS
jgi:iron complex transport system ATP-binding protein